MTDTAINILMLDNNKADCELVNKYLLKRKFYHHFNSASNKKEFIAAIKSVRPHVILSSNSIKNFSALNALALLRSQFIKIPFIVITAQMTEFDAIDLFKAGADDFIIKDRLVRLPAAIEASIKKHKNENELNEYRYAFDHAAMISITDRNGSFLYVNDNFCQVSKYTAAELIGQNIKILRPSNYKDSFFQEIDDTIAAGKTWTGELKNKAKDGSIFWVQASIVPILDENGKPFKYLGIRSDITKQKLAEETLKKLERKSYWNKITEQAKLTRAIIEAQENERNRLGLELHDNVNQILVGTKMYLSAAGKKDKKISDLVKYPLNLIDNSINEIRNLSSRHVTPLKNIDLKNVIEVMLRKTAETSELEIEFEYLLKKEIKADDLKLNLYRVLQEQVNNIVKHAHAKKATISISRKQKQIVLVTRDDGRGFELGKKRLGIGISNMLNRIKLYNGTVEFTTAVNKGCTIEIKIPC